MDENEKNFIFLEQTAEKIEGLYKDFSVVVKNEEYIVINTKDTIEDYDEFLDIELELYKIFPREVWNIETDYVNKIILNVREG